MNNPAAAVLLLYYLLLPPQDVIRCVLWLPNPATSADVAAACGDLPLERYVVNFRNVGDGVVYCTKNALAVYNPNGPGACNLPASLDNYKMEVVEKTGEMLICSIISQAPPTRAQIAAQCDHASALPAFDAGTLIIRNLGRAPLPAEPAPACDIPTPQQPASPAKLATAEPYTWLAGRLIWHGLVTPNCDGYSGLDPLTLAANPCGMASALPAVLEWQNQYDEQIYAAALAAEVPAQLLKAVIAQESQYWPMWEKRPAGETGLAQITPSAADQYLRWYDPTYPGLTVPQQQTRQSEFIRSLTCELCTIDQALERERANIPTYARLLRAYRCAAPDWRAALVLWNGEAYAQKTYQ